MDYRGIIERARELRKNQTPSEKKLWSILRNRKFQDKKILRQHPIFFEVDGRDHFFIADFYCAEKNLVLELDGKVHDYQQDRDAIRDMIINSLGLRILHVRNEKLNDVDKVKEKIKREIDFPLPPSLILGGRG